MENRLLMMLKLISLKIGVFLFLLIVMIVLDVCMLVRCWIVLEMSLVMYSCGEMVLLVWFIWLVWGY